MFDSNFIQGFLGVQIKLTNVAGADWDTKGGVVARSEPEHAGGVVAWSSSVMLHNIYTYTYSRQFRRN
jgi:hypothetical protein